MLNLKRLLVDEDPIVGDFLKRFSVGPLPPQISQNSFLGLINTANPIRCAKMCEILDRVISNLHFSQSMCEYFALDDKIEPAKLVLAEAVKQGPNLGNSLRGGTFSSNAQIFRHLASSKDSDDAPKAAGSRGNRRRPASSTASTTTSTSATPQSTASWSNPYPVGFCWAFQRGVCNRGSECPFKHRCTKCDSTRHGTEACPNANGNKGDNQN